MRKYLVIDPDFQQEEFETIEQARAYLKEVFFDYEEGYHPGTENCRIYQLVETVELEVVDRKENYKYVREEDIPEDDEESEAWPYPDHYDEVCKHTFKTV
jgi:succinylglutamate desuccinylase